MKISVAQINYHIGNFDKNVSLICDAISRAKTDGSDLVIFSELCVPGYPPLDLLDRIGHQGREGGHLQFQDRETARGPEGETGSGRRPVREHGIAPPEVQVLSPA